MVYLFFGDGFEEAEAFCTVDILRRCNVDVTTVSVMKSEAVKGAHAITVIADTIIDDIADDGEMYILPGGTVGVENLSKSTKLCDILKNTSSKIAAICAAPTLLAKLGLLDGKKAICYPSLADELCGAEVVNDVVVIDGRITTSMGPGTSFEFGFALAAQLTDEAVVKQVKTGMLVK